MDFAVVRTRAVTAPAGTFLGEIGLELRDGAGAVVETRTFEDGAWYVPHLAPGRYTLQVAASSLEALGAAAERVSLVINDGIRPRARIGGAAGNSGHLSPGTDAAAA